jgi:hypothetical protein
MLSVRTFAAALAGATLLAACGGTDGGADAGGPVAPVPEVLLEPTDAAPLFLAEVEALHEDAVGRVWLPIYQRPGVLRAQFGAERTVADTFGASGNAPGEFRMPVAVMGAPGGGVFALDGVARRLVGFTDTGAPDTVLAVPPAIDQFTSTRDTLGAWVSLLSDRVRNDSVPLVRATLDGAGATRVDTLTRVHVPRATMSIPMGERSYNAPPEFTARDLWGALADGTVWVARGGTNAVDYWLRGSTRTAGGPRRVPAVRSTDADRGTMRGLPAPPSVPASALQYAPVKGPFLEARSAPDGDVWTWRTQPAGHVEERYTVFRPGTVETYEVVLPLHHRVVGVGATSVYVAERLDDGRWRVTRHPRPAAPAL